MGFEEVEFGSRKVVAVSRPSKPRKREGRASTQKPDPSEPPADTGAVLVPLDQWTSILNQLGNLHQAGQQMADARERAAKAETEAFFLKERLRELREELAKARAAATEFVNSTASVDTEVAPTDTGVTATGDPASGASEIGQVQEDEDVAIDLTTDRVLIVRLPSRVTKWWLERRT